MLAQGRLKDFGPLLLIWGAAMLVLVETNDLGSALLYFGIFLAMLYVATGAGRASSRSGSCSSSPARRPRTRRSRTSSERVDVLAPPVARTCTATCYQTAQGLYSIGERQASAAPASAAARSRRPAAPTLIPYVNTRLHLLRARAGARADRDRGAAARLHGLRAARLPRSRCSREDGFSKLLAAGLTFAFALQTFIIVGGILRESPLTGITLPFVSYGGSSIVANFILLAGLLLVSNRANAPR